jgi:thiol-disulfide isomerase/thioredoxin
MRFPEVVGALVALLLGTVLIVVALATIGAAPITAPTPGVPSVGPIATARASPTTPTTPTPTQAPTATPPVDPGATPGESPPGPEGIGRLAPRIELLLLDGRLLDTAEFAGQPLWINFMATWCPQCQDELPMMEGLQATLGDQLTILVIDVGESPEQVRSFIEALNVDLPVALDTDGAVQDQWGAYALPMHFWVDVDGYVQAILFGGAPEEAFRDSILTVLPDFQFEE